MVWVWVAISFPIYIHLILNCGCVRSPFHASLGIAMGRMLLHLRKFASDNFEAETRRHVFPHLDPTVELSHDEHIRSSGV